MILLDLLQDRFLGISTATTSALLARVANWPADQKPGINPGQTQVGVERLLGRLVSDGLLTETAEYDRPVVSTSVPRPEAALLEHYGHTRPPIRGADLFIFCAACLTMAAVLGIAGLNSALSRVRARKQRVHRLSVSENQIATAAAIFARCRPLLYTARSACLFDSLALVDFLAHRGFVATLVIGVRVRPFGSHAWVQHDGTVLNDSLGRVLKYTPILAI